MPRDLARFYRLFGPRTVFLPIGPKTKKPLLDSWQTITFPQTQEADYQKLLRESAGLGVLQGPPSEGLVSTDFDADPPYKTWHALNDWEATLQTSGARGRNVWLRPSSPYPTHVARLARPREPGIGEWRGGHCQTIVDGPHANGVDQYRIIQERHIQAPKWEQIIWQTPFVPPTLDESSKPILKVQSVLDLPDFCPPIVVPGLLRQGEVILIGGHAKSWKSWALLDLIYCIANGIEWLGFKTNCGMVLHIDLELSAWDIRHRLVEIQKSYGIGNFDNIRIVAHRGLALSLADITRLPGELDWIKLALVSLDPTYRLLADENENEAGVITDLMNKFLSLGTELAAAIALLQHFTKGNQADKEAIDRFSGSSVWGRHPDCLITFTQHEDENCFTVHFICRSFPPVDEFVVHWEFPRFRPAIDRDPEKLKRNTAGRPKANTAEQLVSLISTNEQIGFEDFVRRCLSLLNMKESTFKRRLKDAITQKLIYKSPISGLYALTPQYIERNGNRVQ